MMSTNYDVHRAQSYYCFKWCAPHEVPFGLLKLNQIIHIVTVTLVLF